MYITDSNQYAMELVTYLLVLVVYSYEFIVYMLLKINAFDSIAFFSQCTKQKPIISRNIKESDTSINRMDGVKFYVKESIQEDRACMGVGGRVYIWKTR